MAEKEKGIFERTTLHSRQSKEFVTERIIVKTGTGYFIGENGLRDDRIVVFTEQMKELYRAGIQVVHICSGATALGRMIREDGTVPKVVAAARGQYRLMDAFAKAYGDVDALQVLISHYDTVGFQAIRENLLLQMQYGIVMINGNDAVNTAIGSTTDNDAVTKNIAQLIGADSVLFLTNTEGILRYGEVIESVSNLDEIADVVTRDMSESGTGGMLSKAAQAAQIKALGMRVSIGGGRSKTIITDFASGKMVGTSFV